MGLPVQAVVAPFIARPRRAPVDWRILGDLCQRLAAEGDRDFLDYLARRAHARLALIDSAKALSREE